MPKNTRFNNLTSAKIKEGIPQIEATRQHNLIRPLQVGDFCRLFPRFAEKYPDKYAYILCIQPKRHILQLQGFHLDGTFKTDIIIRRNDRFLVCCTQDVSFFRPLARNDFSPRFPCPDDCTPPSPINSISFPNRRDGIYVPTRFCPETDVIFLMLVSPMLILIQCLQIIIYVIDTGKLRTYGIEEENLHVPLINV